MNEEQRKRKKQNKLPNTVSKTYKEIARQHIFTLFNAINIVLAILIFTTGSYRNALFMGTVTLNALVGWFQEVRSKKMLDKLSLIHQPKATVIIDHKEVEIPVDEIVVGDEIVLKAGDQISVDGKIIEGHIECNESMLTGESEPIEKELEDFVYAGTFVISGKARMLVQYVADDTYSYSILKHAKRFKRYPSPLRDALNTIIKWCSYGLLPLGMILFIKQFIVSNYKTAVLSTVAAVVGMIPEGLVFLTSVALAIASIKLAQKHVLVQELYCIETLARVDTLCLDKTGTLTQGDLKVVHVEAFEDIEDLLGDMMENLPDENATALAIRSYVTKTAGRKAIDVCPFSSARKYSSVTFEDGEYKLGAVSYICENYDEALVDRFAKQGVRVLGLSKDNRLLALLCLQDELREDAKSIMDYFYKQKVDIKIISGDDVETVEALAKQAGIHGNSINMKNVRNVSGVMDQYSIFGRVSPQQKKEMILALKKQGHTVAMTGDGVNDVMALKEADCSIAMGAGSEACKSVSSLVLLENQFEALPDILNHGRSVIHNIERSASLFLVKTIFSFGLSFLTLFMLTKYPFQPIQLTLISSLATGIPSFILTLEPNTKRVKGNFLNNVISKAVPGGTCVILSVIVCSLIPASEAQFSTMCTILAGINALVVLLRVCRPLTKIRKVLVITMCSLFAIAIIFCPNFFYITSLRWYQILYLLLNICLIPMILNIVTKIVKRKDPK